MYRIKPDKVPAWSGWRDMKSHPVKELLTTDGFWERAFCFFFKDTAPERLPLL